MRSWLERIRGAIGMGLTWAFGWAPIGAVVGAILYRLVPGTPLSLSEVVVLNATVFAALGLVGGGIFAGVLRLTEGRRRFDELSLARFAGLGALGGAILGSLAVSA